MKKWLPAPLLFLALALGVNFPVANAAEPYYWKDSYGRGVGTAVTANCGSDVYDAGLCYAACPKDYTGVGPYCWNGLKAQERGVGRVPAYNCGGRDQDAGLCYEQCRSGYKGAGPVCWATPPAGYVDCGAGFALNGETCASVTASQVVAVGMLLGEAIPAGVAAAKAAKQAEMGADGLEEAGRLAKLVEPLLAKLRPLFEEGSKGGTIVKKLAEVKPRILKFLSDDPEQAEQIYKSANYLRKYVGGATSATIQAVNGPDQALDFLRIVTSITGIFDPTPVSGLISSFAYPVYLPAAPASVARADPVVATWNYIYALNGGDLLYYRLDAGGTWGPSGKIGTGWGAMRVVTAGDHGELYALDQSGNLYFYKHDANLQWQSAGAKIGFGFGAMKTIIAGGNYVDGLPQRVLYALGNDGTLWYYRFPESPNGMIQTPAGVQIGWGWDCSKVFAGAGGVLYCIKADGELFRYAYDIRNPTARTPQAVLVGSGWNNFTHVLGGAGGQIYAVRGDGVLLAYRDKVGAVLGPQEIGQGWNFPQVTAAKGW